tara:strand:+ start:2669 stop:3478 length:810 start_codon:yes stop_codon:yes gene_type:complete
MKFNNITIVTSIFIDSDIRFTYFEETIRSFYKNCIYSNKFVHNLIDDRSSIEFKGRIFKLCSEFGINIIEEMPQTRQYFSDTMRILVDSVETDYYLYLEPDYHFYLPYNFIEPILKLYELRPELHQVYLRHGIHNNRGKSEFIPLVKTDDNILITPDGTHLTGIPIDNQNTGWVGKGTSHETFSTNPSIFNTHVMLEYLKLDFNSRTPGDLETYLWKLWEYKKEVGYLNGQSFCYHIGKYGGLNNNKLYAALEPGDIKYEHIYSKKYIV